MGPEVPICTGPGPVYAGCTSSTTVLAEGAARVAIVLNICVRPTITPHVIAETHQNGRRRDRPRETEERRGREGEWDGDYEHDGRGRLNQ